MPLRMPSRPFDIMDGPFQGLRPAAYMLKLHAHEHRNCFEIGFGAHGYAGTPSTIYQHVDDQTSSNDLSLVVVSTDDEY